MNLSTKRYFYFFLIYKWSYEVQISEQKKIHFITYIFLAGIM